MKKNISLKITIYTLLALLLTSCTFNKHSDTLNVLFIAYDQGESNAFIQIEKNLIKQKINYKVLALGRAAEIFANHPGKIELPAFPLKQHLRDDRTTHLPSDIIEDITQPYSPQVIYSGMASTAQAQLSDAFRQRGSYAIGFYDSFDDARRQQYLKPFLKEINTLDELHVPSTISRYSFDAIGGLKLTPVIVTGQPALEAWDEIYQNTDTEWVRAQLGLSPSEPVILFAGGYDTDYEESFRVFLQATKKLPNITFLVTHHPKYDGQLESKLIREVNSSNVKLIPKGSMTTPVLSKIATAIATHKSTVGAQAIYKGKPVVYVADGNYTNFLLENDLALRAYTPEDVVNALMSSIRTKNGFLSLKPMGMPDHPSQVIANRLADKITDLKH